MTDKGNIERADFHLKVIQEISDLLYKSAGLDTILDGVVNKISDSLHLDIVSIYLWDNELESLVLKRSKGLRLNPDKPIILKPGEGLTGTVYKEKKPFVVTKASEHPAYKYFPEIGEKKYESYIGVPVMLHNKCLGVLVGQTTQERIINPAEETLFQIIAFSLAGLLDVVDKLERLTPVSVKEPVSSAFQGKAASYGYAVGHVYLLRGLFQEFSPDKFPPKDVATETRRLHAAMDGAEQGLEDLIRRLAEEGKVTASEVEIFDAHLMLLKDSTLKLTIESLIEEKEFAAESAVIEGIESIAGHFESLEDRYIRERAHDFRDIGERILEMLMQERGAQHVNSAPSDGCVIVGYELGPSIANILLTTKVKGIIMEKGGETTHSTILARSLGIPAVYGIDNIVNLVQPGKDVLIDGQSGFVFLNPTDALVHEYERTFKKHAELTKLIEKEARAGTKSGIPIGLTANVGFPVDVEFAKQYGLTDVGLFRTEFAFSLRDSWPSIKEQVAIYENVAKGFSGYVTIRTLDIGADKPLAYFSFPEEENPLLGLRAVRFSMEYLDFFRDQIKAILLPVKKGRKFRILLPLVSHIWEVETARDVIHDISREIGLDKSQIPPLGIMLEVPAVAYQLKDFSALIDFISIGTNDLIQYLLAVDRSSNVVGHLYSHFHPSVLRMLDQIITTARRLEKPVNVCGEMAGTPKGALALIALGYTDFSLIPYRAPIIKHLAQHMDPDLSKKVRKFLLSNSNEFKIRLFLRDTLFEIDPDLAELELD